MANPFETPPMPKPGGNKENKKDQYPNVDSYIKEGLLKNDKLGAWLLENQINFDPTQVRFFEKRGVEDLMENINKGMPMVTLEYFEMLAGLGYKQNVYDLRKTILDLSDRNFTKEKYMTKEELENFFEKEYENRTDKMESEYEESPGTYTQEDKRKDRHMLDKWLTASQQLTFGDNALVGIDVIEKEIEYNIGFRHNIMEAIREASRGNNPESANRYLKQLKDIDSKLSIYRRVRDSLYKRELQK